MRFGFLKSLISPLSPHSIGGIPLFSYQLAQSPVGLFEQRLSFLDYTARVFIASLTVFFIISCVPTRAEASTYRQTVAEPFPIGSSGTNVNMVFTAVASGEISSVSFYASSLINNLYAPAGSVQLCNYPSFTGCVTASNLPQLISLAGFYAFDFSSTPLSVSAGAQYVAIFEPRPATARAEVTIGYVYGSSATSTVYYGTTGTTSAFCLSVAGLLDCNPNADGMVQATFYANDTPLNINISQLYPAATSTGVNLGAAQSFCGSSTYATSTGFWDSTGQAFSRGMCLAFAAVFVPSPESAMQFQNLEGDLQTKVPFSYFYQISSAFTSLQASSTENLPTLSIDLSSVNLGASTTLGALYSPHITILSTSTISRFLSDDSRHAWLNFLRVCLWMMLLVHLYNRVVNGGGIISKRSV